MNPAVFNPKDRDISDRTCRTRWGTLSGENGGQTRFFFSKPCDPDPVTCFCSKQSRKAQVVLFIVLSKLDTVLGSDPCQKSSKNISVPLTNAIWIPLVIKHGNGKSLDISNI